MTASTQAKNGMYYTVLSYYETVVNDGKPEKKRKQKWISTGIATSEKNVVRKLEKIERDVLTEWEAKITPNSSGMLFADWMLQWLDETQGNIAESTYKEYKKQIERQIAPYFKEKKIVLRDLQTYQIQEFYNMKSQEVTANTVRHYHANIHKALSHAVKMGRLKYNPADNVELPPIRKHVADHYTASELAILVEKCRGTQIETVVLLASWFGMRRGEIIGLKWDCVDFEGGTLFVTGVIKDKSKAGTKTRTLYYEPFPKTKSSIRSFPMSEETKNYLLNIKRKQEKLKMLPKYNHEWDEFVCVRENGDLIPLEYVTRAFPELCKKCGLPRLKLHELRHTNISLLLENGYDMKLLQEWAGHSSYVTTANTYSHVQAKSKEKLTASISEILSKGRLLENG